MKSILSLAILVVLVVVPAVQAADSPSSSQLLRIIDEGTSVRITTPEGPFTITRVMTPCAKNRGWLQPLIPVEGVHPVAEIELLEALNDKQALVVDMRKRDDRAKGTIPGSISIPFTEIVKRMGELGCSKTGTGNDCSKAKKVYAFCNGPVCPQSPVAIEAMVEHGFPADKIYYYRGGMLDWEALGLTTVRD